MLEMLLWKLIEKVFRDKPRSSTEGNLAEHDAIVHEQI